MSEPMGYFETMHNRSTPATELNEFDYVFSGFMMVFAPLCAPLYWVGRFSKHVYEAVRDTQ